LPTTVTNVSFNAGLLSNMPATAAGSHRKASAGHAAAEPSIARMWTAGRPVDSRSTDPDGGASEPDG